MSEYEGMFAWGIYNKIRFAIYSEYFEQDGIGYSIKATYIGFPLILVAIFISIQNFVTSTVL